MNDTLSQLVIAEAGAEAIEPVMDIMGNAFDPGFGEAWNKAQCLGILGLPGVWLMLASHEGRVVGFTLARVIADEAELLLIAVSPDKHGCGIGAMLLDNIIETARLRGATRVHLEVRDGNKAVELYQRSGFLPMGRRSAYYRGKFGQSFDALTLSRPVSTIS
jgi:[ribosomal protein S18]-alanine N-acetyltransferase